MHVVIESPGLPFVAGDALDLSAPLAFTVEGVLSARECDEQIARIEELGPAPAPITTARGFVMRPDLRNNTRVMFDDRALAATIFSRVQRFLPDPLFARRAVGANERFRCYKYEPGQRFAAHYDGAFCRDDREASELTLLVYLNDGYAGGATAFLSHGVIVRPVRGMALLFQHHLLHEGCTIDAGCKYVLRTDVMYASV
jgi:hypothetical protein